MAHRPGATLIVRSFIDRALELYTRAIRVSDNFYPDPPQGSWFQEAIVGVQTCGGVPKIRQRPPPGSKKKVAESPSHDETPMNNGTSQTSDKSNGLVPTNGHVEVPEVVLDANARSIELQLMRLEAIQHLPDRPFCEVCPFPPLFSPLRMHLITSVYFLGDHAYLASQGRRRGTRLRP